jgi:DNA-binding CsgD family transcriptional regulator
VRDGLWVTIQAARTSRRSKEEAASIAVTLEPTSPSHRTDLYARAVGLTDREAELLLHLVGGADTRQLADRLFLSQHTVQDHLKSIFAKTGVNTRRLLVARATGVA